MRSTTKSWWLICLQQRIFTRDLRHNVLLVELFKCGFVLFKHLLKIKQLWCAFVDGGNLNIEAGYRQIVGRRLVWCWECWRLWLEVERDECLDREELRFWWTEARLWARERRITGLWLELYPLLYSLTTKGEGSDQELNDVGVYGMRAIVRWNYRSAWVFD